MVKSNFKKLVALMGILFIMIALTACGGGGGGGDATPVVVTPAAGVDVTGTVGGATGMPSLLNSPLFQTATDVTYSDTNAVIEVVDELATTEVDLTKENTNAADNATAKFTGVNQFKVTIPYTTKDRYAVIRIKDKKTLKVFFKNFLGRVPKKTEAAVEADGVTLKKVTVINLKVNETSTAKALYAFEDKANAADFVPPIALKDVNSATEKTELEKKLSERISDLDAKIAQLTMVLEAIKKILLALPTNNVVTEAQSKIDLNTTNSVTNALNGFVQISKIATTGTNEAFLNNAGVTFTKEVTFEGVKISGTTETTVVTNLKPVLLPNVKMVKFFPAPEAIVYDKTLEVSITCETPGAKIKYIMTPWEFTPGVIPVNPEPMTPSTFGAHEYTGPFNVMKPVRIMAIGYMVPGPDGKVTHVHSAPITVFYNVKIAAPRTLESIILGQQSATVEAGKTFILKNVPVTAKYTNGTTSPINTPGMPQTNQNLNAEVVSGGGTIVDSTFTAPATAGTVVIKVTYVENGVSKSANFTFTVTAAPVANVLTVTTPAATKDATGNLTLTWATNKAVAVKAKVTFWTGDVPNTTDKSVTEAAVVSTLTHTMTINAADVPASFIKMRIAYIVSEDEGAFADILKTAITTATVPPVTGPFEIVTTSVTKDASGNHVISWTSNKAATVKAKVTFWSGDVPNTQDKSVTEASIPTGTAHSITVNAADVPASFVKIRIAYIISEDEGTFKDVLKAEIK